MFKFLHAADIHLDSPLRGLSRHDTAPVDAIRGACRRAFENLVERAIDEQVAFVLLAGDIYDGDWKDYSTGIFLSRQLGRLGKHGIPVFAVAGNHDAANRMTKALDGPANLHILGARQVESVHLDTCRVTIHGRSFETRHVHDNLAAGFPPAETGRFNIGLLHTSLDGREGHAPYAPCSIDDLRATGYDYWALGHVHQQEFVARDPWIVFPGCLQGRHSRETGAKGCVLVTVAGGSAAVEPIELDVLRWERCGVDLGDAADMPALLVRLRQVLTDAVTAADGRPLALRLCLQGATPLADRLGAYPERLEQQIRALAAETAGDDLWIERVELALEQRLSLDDALAEDRPLARLLHDILAMPAQAGQIDGLDDALAELKQKLPPEALAPDSALDLGDAQNLERLIHEARRLLVGRLLSAGDPG
ncbi:MAG: DNA repair exonuclease [Thiothrix sp.]|nr:DNA repair exonuclease [Thiothrix sp.]HPE59153.1 DNA repair exonuclease [Thiolinea sp.]